MTGTSINNGKASKTSGALRVETKPSGETGGPCFDNKLESKNYAENNGFKIPKNSIGLKDMPTSASVGGRGELLDTTPIHGHNAIQSENQQNVVAIDVKGVFQPVSQPSRSRIFARKTVTKVYTRGCLRGRAVHSGHRKSIQLPTPNHMIGSYENQRNDGVIGVYGSSQPSNIRIVAHRNLTKIYTMGNRRGRPVNSGQLRAIPDTTHNFASSSDNESP